MITLQHFLENSPRAFVGKLRSRSSQNEGGLASHQKILTDAIVWATQIERCQTQLSNLNSIQKQILLIIYLSGNQGIDQSSLQRFFSKEDRLDIKNALNLLRWHLFIFRSESPHFRYYGFADFFNLIIDSVFQTIEKSNLSTLDVLDHSFKAPLRLTTLYSEILHNPRAPKQDGTLNEKHFHNALNRWNSLKEFDPIAHAEELNFAFDYAKQLQWIGLSEDVIVAIPKLEIPKTPIPTFQNQLIHIWCDHYLAQSQHLFKKVLHLLKGRVFPAALFLNLFQFTLKAEPKSIPQRPLNYSELPQVFRELIWLGVFQIYIQDSKIVSMSLGQAGLLWIQNQPITESMFWVNPDFEVLIPIHSSIHHFFNLELCAKGSSDESVLKFRIDKDRYISSLKCGIDHNQIETWIEEISPPEIIKRTVIQWGESNHSTRFSSAILLEVKSKSIREALEKMPESTQWFERTLSDFGFIVHKSAIDQVQKIIEGFGFCPTPLKSQEQKNKLFKSFPEHPPLLTQPIIPEYSNLEEPKENSTPLENLSRYSTSFKNLNYAEKMRLIEYGILTEHRIEVISLKNPEQKTILLPQKIANKTSPIQLIGINELNAEIIHIEVEDIEKVRLWIET